MGNAAWTYRVKPTRRWFMAIITAHGSPDAFISAVHTHTNTKTPLPFSFYAICEEYKSFFILPNREVSQKATVSICMEVIIHLFLLLPGSPPPLTSPTHERSHAGPHSRSGWDELAPMLNTYWPHCLKPAVLHLLMLIYTRLSLLLSSAGLHETLALLTSQLRPDANHKEDMVFLKDVFSERSLGYLMKVRVSLLIPWVTSLFTHSCVMQPCAIKCVYAALEYAHEIVNISHVRH